MIEFSDEHRQKLREAGQAREWPKTGERNVISERQTGAGNSNWTGDGVGYRGAHKRVAKVRGRASEHMCKCGKAAREWANLTGDYTNIDDYEAMCTSCHRLFDYEKRRN